MKKLVLKINMFNKQYLYNSASFLLFKGVKNE